MDKNRGTIVHRTLLSWIFAGNLKLQLLLLLTVIVAVVARVLPLEMQKRIVNEAIQNKNIDLLMTYSAVYLAAFITAGGLKFLINALQTVIGQNSLSEMRRQLYGHILKLPLGFFRKTQSGLIVSSMVTELATAGDFVGMAVAIPLANLMTLTAFAVYLFWLNPLLAAVSFSMYPAVIFLVPKLQKRVNQYNRKRVEATRSLSGRLGESVDGIHEIKANAAFDIENRSLGKRIEGLRKIRIAWNLHRFAVKVINNLFTNFSRFLIFGLGGYLALNGRLELGALVAFLSAQEKLYDPWKELIRFYQAYQTAVVTYKRTMDYYAVETDPESINGEFARLKGGVEVHGLSVATDEDKTLIKGVTFSLQPGEHMALVGGSGSGKSTLVHCLMGLFPLYEGRYELDGRSVSEIDRRHLSANLGSVFQTPMIFSGSIRENLLYGCRAVRGSLDESGGIALPDLHERIEVLQQTGLFIDVLGFGLSARLDPRTHERHLQAILDVRAEFRNHFAEETAADIEVYDDRRYLYHSTVAENLLFGSAVDSRFTEEELPRNDFFNRILRQAELLMPLTELGASFADRILDIFGHLPALPANIPLTLEEIGPLRQKLNRAEKHGLSNLAERDRHGFLGLALRYIPAVHKVVDIPESLTRRVVAARHTLVNALKKEAPKAVCFYRPDAYLAGASVLQNIIFGRITSESSHVKNRINTNIHRLLVEEELLEAILEIGMNFQVGRGGEKLSGGQRQKLALARAFLKKPSILLLDEATASLDNESQDRVQKVLESRWKGRSTLVAVVHRLDIIKNYDKIAVMEAGKIEEIGTYGELMKKKGRLYRLVQKKS